MDPISQDHKLIKMNELISGDKINCEKFAKNTQVSKQIVLNSVNQINQEALT